MPENDLKAGVGAEGGVLAVEEKGNVFSVGGNANLDEMITLPSKLFQNNNNKLVFIDKYSY